MMLSRSARRTVGIRFFGKAVKYNVLGAPSAVAVPSSAKAMADEVSIKILAAPVNPSDLIMIGGVDDRVGGEEGVAVVTDVGSNAKRFAVGDWVIPYRSEMGTWRTDVTVKEAELVKVPKDIPVAYAASLSSYPATAYRLLRDFENLKPGDVIMQNGANSMVGLTVIQMAREMGIKTINIIRSDRSDTVKVTRMLANLGGDLNVLDTQVNTSIFKEVLSDLPVCRLALDCEGGDVVTDMARCLGAGGSIVSHSGAKRPITLPVDLLTYKQLKLEGFSMSAWYKAHDADAKTRMMAEIATMIREKKLTAFYEMHDFDDFQYALQRAAEDMSNFRRVLLNMDHPDRLVEHDSKAEKEFQIFETTVM